jgi:hypothetical protein
MVGKIARSKRTELILLRANPLEDAGRIEQRVGVMVRGRWVSEAEIQKRLEEIAGSY